MSRLHRLFEAHWPYLFVVVVPVTLFIPFLSGNQVLYWGTPVFQFYPWRKFALDMIHSGRLPLWNPYVGNGSPLIANYQSAIFYPPNWLSLLLPLAYSFSWLVVLHLILAGAGMVILAKSLGLKPFGQVVAGLAYGMSQYLVARAAFFSVNAALAWLPWILWAGDRLLMEQARDGIKYALLLTAFTTLQLLAGHAQTAWYTLLLLGVWSLVRFFSRRPLPVKRLFILAASLLLAAGLAAIQLLPTAEFLSRSSRASQYGYEAAMVYSYSPARLLTLFAPDLFGNPARGQFFGYGYYWEDADYIGLLPILLALGFILSTLFSLRRASAASGTGFQSALPRPLAIFLILVLPATFILALGINTPVFPFLYNHVPSFNMFQGPTRMMIWFVFSLALLAGAAADQWKPVQGRGLYWTRLGLMGALTLIVFGSAGYRVIPASGQIGVQIHSMARAIGLAGVCFSVTAILTLIQPPVDSPRRKIWALGVAVFLALDVIYANWGINPGASPDIYNGKKPSASQTMDGSRLFIYPDDDRLIKYDSFLMLKSFGPPSLAYQIRAAQMVNTNLLDGLPSANVYDPLIEDRTFLLLDALNTNHDQAILDLMDVGRIFTLNPDHTFQYTTTPGTPERARLVTASRTVESPEAALQAIFDKNFDPDQTVILEGTSQGASGPTRPSLPVPSNSPTPPKPRILAYAPDLVRISVDSPSNGWLVLSDSFYPGWVVTVDGQRSELLRADYVFRGVAVSAGSHQIEFRYEPLSFRIGSWITGICLLVYLSLWIGYTRLNNIPISQLNSNHHEQNAYL